MVTGWRGVASTVDEARAQFDTPLMKQFLIDLRSEAGRRHVTIEQIDQQLGRWQDSLEPSLHVKVRNGREGVLKLAASLGAQYNQDAVLVLSRGKNATVYSIELPSTVDHLATAKLLDAAGLPGSSSSLDGRHLTLIAKSGERGRVKRFLDSVTGETVEQAKRGADFIERNEYAKVLALAEKHHAPEPFDLHFPVGALAA